MHQNKLVNTLNTIVDYFLLNLLWFFTSLPLFTLFSATAAMFGVVRKQQLQKESKGIVRDFFALFKENFKQSIMLSIIWGLVALFLYIDYMVIDPTNSIIQLILYVVFLIGLILFSVMSIYLFPTMVHFELNWKQVIRNTFFFTLMNPVLSILLVVIVGVGLVILYKYPAAIFIIGSPLAYVIYYLCQKFFNQVLISKDMNKSI